MICEVDRKLQPQEKLSELSESFLEVPAGSNLAPDFLLNHPQISSQALKNEKLITQVPSLSADKTIIS